MTGPRELDWLQEPVQPAARGAEPYLAGSFVAVLQRLTVWLRGGSLGGLGLNLSCCGPELLAATARYGLKLHAPHASAYPDSVRRSNLLVVAGTVNEKLADALVGLYGRLAPPKYVVAMGACACTGGPFWDTYNVVDGVHKLFPVDVYVGGCPPPPEALIQGLWMVQEMAAGRLTRGQTVDLQEPLANRPPHRDPLPGPHRGPAD